MPSLPAGGKTGQLMSRVHEVFRKRLVDLRDQAKKIQNAHQGKHQRVWQIPSDYPGSLLDIANLHDPSFNREEINSNYEEVTKDPKAAGTNGDVIGLKLQLDYNACEERAFRARHNTLCRAMCLGHARRYGQGHGNLWDEKQGVEGMIASFIAAGGVGGGS